MANKSKSAPQSSLKSMKELDRPQMVSVKKPKKTKKTSRGK